MGDWAYNVALMVYVYQRTHSAAWVSGAILGRMIPRLVSSMYAGVIAERFERTRVMIAADLIRAGIMTGLTVVVATHGPALLAIALAGCLAATASVYDPATAAMLPQLLGEEDLAAGNALTETINNVAIIAGPAVGAIVLALGSGAIVMGLDAVTFLVSAFLVSRVTARSTPTDVAQDGGVVRQMMVGVNAVVRSSTASLLVGFSVVTTMLYGLDAVLFIFVSKDKLGTGAEGYGYLLVALGVGGVLAAMVVNRLAAMPRLSLVLSVGMIVFAAPNALLVVVHQPTVAFIIEVIRGAGTLIVDVLAMTALQRSLAPDMVARVFGAFWALVLSGLCVGTLITPFLLNGVGLNTTLLLDGLVVPAAVVLIYPRLASLDRIAAVQAVELAPRVSVFQQLDIFGAANRPALERMAKSATEILFEPGTSVIREGETADALYVLVDGKVEITARGERGRKDKHIRFMTAPTYVGEIGLLQRIPRTANVTAVTPTKILRIDGDTFLDALTESTLSASFVSGMNTRLKRTHPSQQISIPEQRVAEPPPAAAETETAPVDAVVAGS
jgi:CRP-like cAMP-binding protein/predicted MFS family arabinose efflux permease